MSLTGSCPVFIFWPLRHGGARIYLLAPSPSETSPFLSFKAPKVCLHSNIPNWSLEMCSQMHLKHLTIAVCGISEGRFLSVTPGSFNLPSGIPGVFSWWPTADDSSCLKEKKESSEKYTESPACYHESTPSPCLASLSQHIAWSLSLCASIWTRSSLLLQREVR